MSQNGEFGPTAADQGASCPSATDRQPVHGIDLAGYAALMTRLASGQPRGLLLSAANLDERTWLEVEKIWGLRLAEASRNGDMDTIRELERGVAEAHQACPPPDPTRQILDYAAIVASIENGATPVAVCAAFGLKLSEFFGLQQAWTRRIVGDPALAKTFREMVASAKESSKA